VRVDVVELADGRLPTRWSPTAVGDYLSCNLKFWFGRVWGWREPTSQALIVGTIVHGVLEDVLALPPAERVLERAMALLPDRVAREFADEPTAAGRVDSVAATEFAAHSLNSYFLVEDPTRIDVLEDGLERGVTADLGDVGFFGKVDRLAKAGDLIRLTDYKTGKASPNHMWDKFRQQYLYVAGLRVLGQSVDEIELLFLGGDSRAVRRPVYRAAVDRALAELQSAVDGATLDLAAKQWTASPGPLCRYCSFASACPDRRGDAPKPGTPKSEAILVNLGLERRSSRTAAAELKTAVAPDLIDLADADPDAG
jgi:putative RecB family exonuclease